MKKSSVKRAIGMGLSLIMAVGLVTGCSNGGEKENLSASIKWYMPIGANPDNEAVFEKADELVREKLGAKLDIVALTFGNYESKIQTLCAANQTFDIMFTSNWANNYYNNISSGTLLPLNDYLENMPELYNSIPEYFWKGCTVDGKIYGVPNQQIAARNPALLIPERNVELLGIDTSKYAQEYTDYNLFLADAEEYLTLLNQKTGTYANANDFWSEGIQIFGMEEILGSQLPGVIRYSGDEPMKLVNQYESQEFIDYIKLRRKWQQSGLVQPESGDGKSLITSIQGDGAIPYVKVTTYKPGVESETEKAAGFPIVTLMKTPPIMTTGGTVSTMTGVSATSKNPELAMKFIEQLNTDKELYNLLSFGIEGRNYTKLDENTISLSTENVYSAANWALGNVYNSYLTEGQSKDVWEQTKKMNDEAISSPLLGFSPNLDSVKSQVAGCKAVIEEYYNLLVYGVVDVDAVYPEFIQKLKSAGVDKLITEIQAQIDAWAA